jgi:predicted dienelactone hydrolase
MRIRVILLAIALLFGKPLHAAVGFQQVTIPDAQGKPIAAGIWYPTSAQPSPRPLGMLNQTVALDAELSGNRLPLILVSHGTGGSLSSHYDTAIALADAGFVVVAVTHTGDNYMDQSYVGNRKDVIDRPRQMKLALDWILSSWVDHRNLDAGRIGFFGFSLGGFTGLVEVGGTPELSRMKLLCSTRPTAPECAFIESNHGDQLAQNSEVPVWIHDSRIKAAVIVAPAASFVFGPGDLRNVNIPVQLWRAENDSQAPDAWNSAVVRKELPNHPEEHVMPGVDHFIFLAPCSDALAAAAPAICQDAPGFNRAAFHKEFNAEVVKFFSTKLKSR